MLRPNMLKCTVHTIIYCCVTLHCTMLGCAKLWYTIMLYIKRNKVGVEEKEEKGRRI